MQPFAAPPKRGLTVVIALLTAGFLAAATVAVVEFVQLRSAKERIAELESELARARDGQGSGGDMLGELGQLFEDLLGENAEDLFGQGDGGGLFGDQAGLLQCLGGGGFPGLGGGSEEPSGSPDQQVDQIAARVEELRELRFEENVDAEFLSSDETGRRVRALFLEEYTAEIADAEERVLSALGAIPPGTDLRDLRAEALGQQVAGFYEPETGELVVRLTGQEITALDRITLAHELDHALTDQTLGIPLPDDLRAGQEDADLAALSVVEGDATLIMQQYSTSLSLGEQLELFDPTAIAQAEAGLADMPFYLEQQLLFPYQEGLSFVCGLYAQGGWEAVNQAYRDPPDSSAEILFPERFGDGDPPTDPRPPAGPGGEWQPAPVQQFGAANLLWLVSAPGGDPARALAAPQAAAGEWAGGAMYHWTRGPETTVSLVLEDRPGGGRLCDSISDWYGRAIAGDREQLDAGPELVTSGPSQHAVLTCEGEEVRLGIGPQYRMAVAVTR